MQNKQNKILVKQKKNWKSKSKAHTIHKKQLLEVEVEVGDEEYCPTKSFPKLVGE